MLHKAIIEMINQKCKEGYSYTYAKDFVKGYVKGCIEGQENRFDLIAKLIGNGIVPLEQVLEHIQDKDTFRQWLSENPIKEGKNV